MNNLEKVKEELYNTNASLVVQYKDGRCNKYYNSGIKDIITILKDNKEALKDAIIADKVIGKVAGSILALAGVKEIYADTISEIAIPVLENNSIKYDYKNKVEYIQNRDKTGMCPMESKFKDENNLMNIYNEFVK